MTDSEIKEEKSPFDLSKALTDSNKTDPDNVGKTLIGNGKTVNDLKALAAAATLKKDNQSNKASDVTIISGVGQEQPIPPIKKVDHTENILKLITPHFADSRQKALAHKKLVAYFAGHKG